MARSASPMREVLDSVSTQTQLAMAWPRDGGLAVARVGGTNTPVSSPVRVWSERLTEAQRGEVEAILASNVRIDWDGDERAYFFVGDENGVALRRLDRLGQCAPTIVGRSLLERRIAAEARSLAIQQRVVVRLFVFVTEDGRVRETRIDESSGNVNVDLAAARVFEDARFTPARIEGMPAPVWVSFPVTFTPRPSDRGAM